MSKEKFAKDAQPFTAIITLPYSTQLLVALEDIPKLSELFTLVEYEWKSGYGKLFTSSVKELEIEIVKKSDIHISPLEAEEAVSMREINDELVGEVNRLTRELDRVQEELKKVKPAKNSNSTDLSIVE